MSETLYDDEKHNDIDMSRLLTTRVATITEMREPHKVLEDSGSHPVAVLRNSKCVGYFVPTEVVDQVEVIPVPRDVLLASMKDPCQWCARPRLSKRQI